MTRRTDRVDGELQREIAAIISGELKNREPALKGLISVTEVDAAPDFKELRAFAVRILQEESELNEIVRLVGADALSGQDRLTLETAKSIREDFLHQNAFHETDTYSSIGKQCRMLRLIREYHRLGLEALAAGAPFERLSALPVREKIGRAKYIEEGELSSFDMIFAELKQEIRALEGGEEGV